jgi:T-complex protein 1 subunit gamma
MLQVFGQNVTRNQGHQAQLNNISSAKAVSDIIRTTLGPRAMLKMILDPMGGIVVTNDGNSILREVDVNHPAAKHMLELSRAQDEEVGDGTTSVIILAGEMLSMAQRYVEQNIHPIKIVQGFACALDDAVIFAANVAVPLDIDDKKEIARCVASCLGTKMMGRLESLMTDLAIDAVKTVYTVDKVTARKEIDFKRYAKVEKIPGGEYMDSKVISGVMLNKDVCHPRMKRSIKNPRVILLDCPLEYKKGENAINVELKDASNFELLLKLEEEYVKGLCEDIAKFKPDVVFTEKGLSDIAAHFLMKAGVTAFRRCRKTDNNRIARATGATIVHRTDELQDCDVGTQCGLMEVRKVGDEYFVFMEECRDPKACTILMRGPSKDALNEMERNLLDAMNVARNLLVDPRIVYGGGATEMAVSAALMERSKSIVGVQQWVYQAVAMGLEVIPRTLANNCGANVMKLLTELRAQHAKGNTTWGIDGVQGVLTDVKELGVMEPFAVKVQTLKTSIEACCMLLRIDDVVSGISAKKEGGGGGPSMTPMDQDAAEEGG